MASGKLRKTRRALQIFARALLRLITLALKVAAGALLTILCAGLIFACIFVIYLKTQLKNSDALAFELSDITLAESSVIYAYDSASDNYVELATVHGDENRKWVDYEEIPEDLEHAAVAIEDKRFYKHKGVDWYRTAGALVNMFFGDSTFGGSTITQQLIKNTTHYDDVTVQRKLVEIFRALEFEKTHNNKEEIITWYLNTIYLGEGCYGVGTASLKYFGKPVSELSLAECASLVGITNNPSLYDPYINEKNNKKRQETILQQMYQQSFITEEEYRAALKEKLVFIDSIEKEKKEADAYSYYVDTVIRDVQRDLVQEKGYSEQMAYLLLYSGGLRIYTCMDPKIQQIVDDVYQDVDSLPQSYKPSEQQLQSGIVIQDPYTGDILALSGGTGEKTKSLSENRAARTTRPPGSSIKPLTVYSPGIELGVLTPFTLFNDAKDVVLKGMPSWLPNNDDYQYDGLITVRQAITSSVNTVAAQIVDMLTPEVSFKFLTERYGVSTAIESRELSDGRTISDIGYAAMALGQLNYGATVRDMTAAYSAFVNSGIYTAGRTYSKICDINGNVLYENIPDSHVAISPQTAYQMQSMMRDVVRRGTAYSASISGQYVCGKTGSSSDWQDRWFIGYTPYYVAAVWTGYDIPEHMYFSGNPSCQIWQRVMEKVHEGLEYKEFDRPDGMRQVTVCIDTGLLATEACRNDVRGSRVVTEWVASEYAPVQTCRCHVYVDLCSVSGGLPTANCPEDELMHVAVLDTSKTNKELLTPDVFDKDDKEKQIFYVLDTLPDCDQHIIDPETGWRVDPKTGWLYTPFNDKWLYDPATGKYYDWYSKWEIDLETGCIINPDTGELIDPHTGLVYVPPAPEEPPDEPGGPDDNPEPGGTDEPGGPGGNPEPGGTEEPSEGGEETVEPPPVVPAA